MWLGLVVASKVVWWQDQQSVAVPLNCPPTWQSAQLTVTCAPVSGKVDRL